jgi:LEA14-like dessication related protein
MKKTLVYASLLTGLCLALAVLTFNLSGCSTVGRALNIVNPSYSIRDVRPRVAVALPLSASSIDLEFDVGVDNPNSVSLRLDRLDFDVLVNDNPVINRVISDQGIHIPARGAGNVHLRTRVSYDNIRNIWREVSDVIAGNKARYQIRGDAYYDTPVGQMRFPVTVYSR